MEQISSNYTFCRDSIIKGTQYREYYSREKGVIIENITSGEQYHVPNDPIIAMRILSICVSIIEKEIIPIDNEL